jgi:hypothetical protein
MHETIIQIAETIQAIVAKTGIDIPWEEFYTIVLVIVSLVEKGLA